MLYNQSAEPKSESNLDTTKVHRKFNTALEASMIIDELRAQVRSLNYNKDLHKFLKNCEKLLGTLGSAEVRARQLHKPYIADKPRNDLANAIDYLEKLLLISRLTQ